MQLGLRFFTFSSDGDGPAVATTEIIRFLKFLHPGIRLSLLLLKEKFIWFLIP